MTPQKPWSWEADIGLEECGRCCGGGGKEKKKKEEEEEEEEKREEEVRRTCAGESEGQSEEGTAAECVVGVAGNPPVGVDGGRGCDAVSCQWCEAQVSERLLLSFVMVLKSQM